MNIDTSSVEFYVQAIVTMLVITWPPDPGKLLLFNGRLKEPTKRARNTAALKLALIVTGILAGTALIGRELLQLLGINLGAFGVAGGLVVAAMGFEMLYGGKISRAQGGPDAPEPSESDGLVVPLAIPLIAGPGAITTMIVLVSSDDTGSALLAGLVAAGVLGLVVYASNAWLGDLIGRLSDSALSVALRLGGLLLATMGIQLLLGGVGNFYGLSG